VSGRFSPLTAPLLLPLTRPLAPAQPYFFMSRSRSAPLRSCSSGFRARSALFSAPAPAPLPLRSHALLPNGKAYVQSSNLVSWYIHRWSTKIRITDKCRDLQGQSSKSHVHVVRLTGHKSITNFNETSQNTKIGR